VRPVLEYAAELWAGDISKELTKRAEAVQISFARTILGLNGCQSIPDVLLCAEKLTSRWKKLRLGYWGAGCMWPLLKLHFAPLWHYANGK
jgi:hypothetical protein